MDIKRFAILVAAVLAGFYVIKKLGDRTSALIDAAAKKTQPAP